MFYDNLKHLCESNNMTVTTFLKELNLSTGKGTAWKNGSIPKYEILNQISEYFHVPISYLFQDDPRYIVKSGGYVMKAEQSNNNGNNIINNAPAQSSASDEMSEELLKRFNDLSFDEKLEVFNYIKTIKEE